MQQVFRFHTHLTQLYALHFAKLLHAAALTPDYMALTKGFALLFLRFIFHVTCDQEVTTPSRVWGSNFFLTRGRKLLDQEDG